jgi:CheY-like chemotaxis protein
METETHDRHTVLVVEDDPACVELWTRYLGTVRCRVLSTERGSEALALAHRERPSAVVLDITLPEMDGFEILRALKSDDATRDIPVVMCSGLAEQDRGMREGAAHYLRKPVRYGVFLAALAEIGVR